MKINVYTETFWAFGLFIQDSETGEYRLVRSEVVQGKPMDQGEVEFCLYEQLHKELQLAQNAIEMGW